MKREDPHAWKREKRLDFVEEVLIVGDIVAFISPYYRALEKAKIIKITPKQIKIQSLGYKNITYDGNITTRYSEDVIKIKK